MKFFLYQHYRVVRAVGVIILMLVLSTYLVPSSPVLAESKVLENLESAGKGMGSADSSGAPAIDFPTVVGSVIKVLLGVLGIIFLILIIFAGVKWMTAHGEKDDITKATDTIRQAIIGLAITLAAYAITDFVVSKIVGAVSEDTTTEIKGL